MTSPCQAGCFCVPPGAGLRYGLQAAPVICDGGRRRTGATQRTLVFCAEVIVIARTGTKATGGTLRSGGPFTFSTGTHIGSHSVVVVTICVHDTTSWDAEVVTLVVKTDIHCTTITIWCAVRELLTASLNRRKDTLIARTAGVLSTGIVIVAVPGIFTTTRDYLIRADVIVTAVDGADVTVAAISHTGTAAGDRVVLAIAAIAHVRSTDIGVITVHVGDTTIA